jgi:hypothetical protein
MLVILNMTAKFNVSFTLSGDGSYTVLQNTNMGWQIKDAMILRSGLYVSLSAFEGMVVECDAQ